MIHDLYYEREAAMALILGVIAWIVGCLIAIVLIYKLIMKARKYNIQFKNKELLSLEQDTL